MKNSVIQWFILLLIIPLFFGGMLALLVIVWYIALPLLIVLFILSWIRARQIRHTWEQFYASAFQSSRGQTSRFSRVNDDNIIEDTDYEEVKE